MKKIVSLVLLLALAVLCFASCSADKQYTLTVAVDNVVDADTGAVTNTVVALLLDKDGKVVAARFDTADAEFALENGELVTGRVTTKVELGDNYPAMEAGTWAEQGAAYEAFVVGKTAEQIAGTDHTDKTVIAGCTMFAAKAAFQRLMAKAFAYEHKVSFTSATVPTLGVAMDVSVSGSVNDGTASVSGDYAAVAMVGGKVVACALDSNSNSAEIAVDGATLTVTPGVYEGTKNERGDDYEMTAGTWYNQAQAFADSAVGKTAEELEDLDTVSDALEAAGCTMQYTTGGYKAVIIRAAGAVR